MSFSMAGSLDKYGANRAQRYVAGVVAPMGVGKLFSLQIAIRPRVLLRKISDETEPVMVYQGGLMSL
jgi:hypothetical protein